MPGALLTGKQGGRRTKKEGRGMQGWGKGDVSTDGVHDVVFKSTGQFDT